MKKLALLLFTTALCFAGVYDYPYLINSKEKYKDSVINKELMYGDFQAIIRFKPIYFNPSTNTITNDSKNYLDEIVKTYKKYANKTTIVTIIGHTDRVQTKTEKVNQSWWYPTYPNDLTQKSSEKLALSYANYVQDQLLNKGIHKNNILIEQRGGLDNLYTSETKEGRDLNYRAMVTLYVKKDLNADSDGDGVIDSKDKCPMTPKGHKVNVNGCSTILNLTINYDVASYNITKDSSEKLKTLVDFMKKNKKYKVVLYGYTSNEGSNLKNQILSEKRALSIRKYLIKQGIISSRIATYGKSSSEPIASNETKEGREKNRRVEVQLY